MNGDFVASTCLIKYQITVMKKIETYKKQEKTPDFSCFFLLKNIYQNAIIQEEKVKK